MPSDPPPDSTEFNAHHTPWEALGGDEVVRALADAFYVCMDTNPAYAELRALHADDLAPMQEKFFEFLSGWLGGPPRYVEKHGHPRLRMRHASFPINESMRDQWLACMQDAMNHCEIEGQVREFLDGRFAYVANFLRNVD